jgi:putative molybdopterin biosynthesis protein
MEKVFYTPQQIAEMLGVRKETIYRLIKKGEIPSIRIGTRYKVLKEQFEEWRDRTIEIQTSERKKLWE